MHKTLGRETDICTKNLAGFLDAFDERPGRQNRFLSDIKGI
jgi:hypothetical protein